MQSIILDFLNFLGVTGVPVTVSEFLYWFICRLVGIEFILFLFDGIFYVIRSMGRGAR